MKYISAEELWLVVDRHPELHALTNVPQDPVYHPEGSALQHTICTVDAMQSILSRENITGDRATAFLLTMVCHDMGKAVSTKFDEVKQRWVSPGHDVTGVPIARAFLERLQVEPDQIEWILRLVRYHMAHCRSGFTVKAIRKLARNLQPANIGDLLLVMEADCLGRGTASSWPPRAVVAELVPHVTSLGLVVR